jgi:hypothetical protein
MIRRSALRSALVALTFAAALTGCSQQELAREPGYIDLSLSFDALAGAVGLQTDIGTAGVPVGSTPDYLIVRVYETPTYNSHIGALVGTPFAEEPTRVAFTAQSVQSPLGGTTMFVLAPGGNLQLSVRKATGADPNPLTIVVNVVDASSEPTPTPQGSFPTGVGRLAYGALAVMPANTSALLVPTRALADAGAEGADLSPRLPVAFVYPGVAYDYLFRIRSEDVGGQRFILPFADLENVIYEVVDGAANVTPSSVGVRAIVNASIATNFTVRATADALVAAGENGDFALEKRLKVTAVGIPYGAGGLNFDTVPPTITNLSFNNATRELSGTALDAETGILRVRIYEGAKLLASTVTTEQTGGVTSLTFGSGGSFGTGTLDLAANGDRYDLDVVAVDLANNQAIATITVGPIGSLPGADAVYYVAKSGNDTNIGTFGAPWLTIGKAVALLSAPNENVFLGAGTYAENVTISANTYVIDGQTKASRIIQGDVTITGSSTNVTLKNLTINGNLSVGAVGTPVANFVMQNVDVTGSITILPTSQISTASAPLPGTAFFCAQNGSLSGSVTNLTLCTEANLTVENFTVEEEITFEDSNGVTTTPPANVTFTNVTAPNDQNNDVDLSNVWVGSVIVSSAALGSFNNPHSTIGAGIAAVSANGIVHVRAGAYTAAFTITKSLTLRGPNANVDGASAARLPEAVIESATGAISVNGADGAVVIEGLKLMGTDASLSRGIRVGTTTTIPGPLTIRNNIIDGYTTGVTLGGGQPFPWVSNVTIFGNLLVNNVAGIGSTENVSSLSITNNTFRANSEGIGLGGGLTGLIITTNTFESSNAVHIAEYALSLMPENVLQNNTFPLDTVLVGENGARQVKGTQLADYGTFQQLVTGYSANGAGGWSAPSGVILGGGFEHSGLGTVHASFPAQPSTAYPHYTYGANEYGWNVYNGGTEGAITIYGIHAALPPGYGIVSQTITGFSPNGWAGWSVPAGKVILGGGFEANGPVAASAPAGPGSVWPHYTYGASEYGWVVQSAGATTITIHAIYADKPAGYAIVKSEPQNYSGSGWAGWSVQNGKVVTGGGFQLPGAAYASRPGLPSQPTPFGYTYASDEYGWIVRNGGTAGTGYIYVIYAEKRP